MDIYELLKSGSPLGFEYDAREIIKAMSARKRLETYENLMADIVAADIMQEHRDPNKERMLGILAEYVSWPDGESKPQIDERLTKGKMKKMLDALEQNGWVETLRSKGHSKLCAAVCKKMQDLAGDEYRDISEMTRYEYKPFEDYFGVENLAKKNYKAETEGLDTSRWAELMSILDKAIQ